MNPSFNIDLHVHTARYSRCAPTLVPQQIEEYARLARLDAVVLTDHDCLWENDALKELQAQCSHLKIYNGMELTVESGHHFVIIGIPEQGPLQKGIDAVEAIRFTHESGGVVILAHPYRNGLPPLRIVEQVDALERASTSLSEKEAILASHLAETLDKPAVASSDAHSLVRIGWGYTSFPVHPKDAQQLCHMIREGLGKVCLPNPFF